MLGGGQHPKQLARGAMGSLRNMNPNPRLPGHLTLTLTLTLTLNPTLTLTQSLNPYPFQVAYGT